MNKDRKEYLKTYRLNHKEQYRKYNKKYRENNLTTYDRLKQENNQLKEQRQELRSWLQDEIIDSKAGGSQYYWFGRVLSKLNELEGDEE